MKDERVSDEEGGSEKWECNGTAMVEGESSANEEEGKTRTKDLPQVYNPGKYLPRLEDFELVVASVEQLRALIKKFGDLPENAGGSSSTKESKEQKEAKDAKEGGDAKERDAEDEEDEEEEKEANTKKAKEETRPQGKRPMCEVKLHRALCNLLNELSPWESKLLAANKRMRTKMRHEWTDYQKRDENYVDPAEEAWASDPEPEPEPPPPPPQESSSSSSSSEESLDEEGNPKRKLRKRRAKQQAASLIMENTAPAPEVASVATPEETSDGYAVSSRGRIRKVKKMINYDGLDFEKLALQASLEAEQERVRKKRKKEEEEREREEQENSNSSSNNSHQPMSGVRRYLMSQTGRLMGYIDNEGQVHSGSAVKDSKGDRGVDISSVRNLASQLVSGAKKEGTHTPLKTGVSAPSETVQNSSLKPGVPTVVVAAINNQGSPVYVRVVGEQALQLVKYMRPSTKGPVSQIKLQHHGQTYTVNTNAHMITHNIPGMPDGEATEKPSPSTTQSGNSAVPPTSALNQPRPATALQALSTSTSPSGPRVAPVSNMVTSAPNPPNTLALAYRGVSKPTRPLTISTPSRPTGTLVPGAVALQNPNHQPALATTRLVSASPSVVSSVVPPTVRSNASLGSSTHSVMTVSQQVSNRQPAPTVIASSPRPPGTPVVNRIAVSSGVAHSNVGASPHQPGTQVVVQQQQPQQQTVGQQQPQLQQQQQQTVVQTPAPVTLASSQPLGQAVTVTSMAVPGAGGQVQLKLESESLAQLMQRTGSKIVALPNGRGGYTLSLTPGAVTPGQAGQKAQQTQIAANTAAKVQVVSCTTPILQEASPPPAPQQQQQQQVIQQQAHIISPQGVSRTATVVHPGMAAVPRAAGVVQQQVVRQVVPVSQTHVLKDAGAATQVVTSSGSQQQTVYQRVGVPQRVYNQLVTATSSAPATTSVPASQHTLATTVVNANQQVQGALQHAVVQKAATSGTPQTVSFQATSPGGQQQQFVVQQRVVPSSQVTTQATPTVVQQGTGGATTTFKPMVISQGVQQGGQQVVRVAHTPVIQQQQQQQVVRLQHASPTNTTQKLVQIVQPGGARQVVQMVQQVVATQAQATAGHQGLIYVQGSGQVIQQQPKTSIGTIQQSLAQPQQQQVVVGQVAQQQILQQQQQQQVAVQPQQQIVQQQQILRHQPQATHQVTQQQAVVQQQQTVVQQQQPAPQQQQTQPQVQQGRLVLLRTNQGEQVCLQHADGRVSLLSQEQLQAVIRNGSSKAAQQT
ncbi:histone-lysine N-methyltransferase trr-like [Penaeus chinensis]|uniref:histone-lysine N-methyltransferase trr-like n=1 Tax=Penaeus chinensis TaxID=139456 RepID=UPI001FB74A7F|nr:histone-lysine N-methyltransferase trr-like [Penaeus chinensis]